MMVCAKIFRGEVNLLIVVVLANINVGLLLKEKV